ncbi:MAG: hypothetical protein DWB56_12190 [Candidatus Jettenia sp.]|nr:hypothetical protein [Candidatus Jettenia sp.]
MFRKFKVFRYAMNTPLTPLKRGINTPPTPSREGSRKVSSWEGIEGWVKSRWVLSFKTQPNLRPSLLRVREFQNSVT